MSKSNPAIVRRVLRTIGDENFIDKLLATLSPSEISTLQLAINKELTSRTEPKDLLKKYEENRFAKPSKLDPIKVKQVELALLEAAKQAGFLPVLLSPVSLLGCCSAIAQVDQNIIISATRGLEAPSDSTNMLALYLAAGIKDKTLDNRTPIQLSSTCRVTRAQSLTKPEFASHFSLFSMVSSGRDTGSYTFEREAIESHLNVYLEYLREKMGFEVKLHLNRRGGYTDAEGFMERIERHIQEAYPELDVTVNKEASENSYYKGLNFKLYVNGVELADGGFVDWTQKLLGNKKERLLISGTGIDLQFNTGLRK